MNQSLAVLLEDGSPDPHSCNDYGILNIQKNKGNHVPVIRQIFSIPLTFIYFLSFQAQAADDDFPQKNQGCHGGEKSVASSNMFSKLVFKAPDEDPIEFHAHELVKVAQELVKEIQPVKLENIPSYASYSDQVEEFFGQFTEDFVSRTANLYGVDEEDLCSIIEFYYHLSPSAMFCNPMMYQKWSRLMTYIKNQKDKGIPVIEEEYDAHILPVQLPAPSYSVSGWLGLAQYVKEQKEPISGWWVNVGNRLILLKTPSNGRQSLYVSDHGFQEEVVRSTKDVLLMFTEEGQKQQVYSFCFCNNFYKELSGDEKDLLKQRFFLMLNNNQGGDFLRNEFLLYALSLPEWEFEMAMRQGNLETPFPLRTSIGIKRISADPWVLPLSDEEIRMFKNISKEEIKEYEKIFKITIERIRHRGEVQTDLYIRSLFEGSNGGLSAFFTQIDNISHPLDAERYRVFYILKEISKKSGNGCEEYLFRPLHCFGTREEGESYRGFAEAFDEYFKNPASYPAHELAKEARVLLQGNVLKDESLYFLPNLVAAWFISEVARNNISVLSGLMLLDLIESRVPLIDEEGHNRYDWKHTLVHPKKPADSSAVVMIKDLYGQDIDLAKFDGMYPMAHGRGTGKHGGSVNHSRQPLGNGQKLSPVRQKEGHLIIHWLLEKLRGSHNVSGVSELLVIPDYAEIGNLLKAKDKPSSRMAPQMKTKWNYLQIIKGLLMGRLNTLDNLLVPNDLPKAAPMP